MRTFVLMIAVLCGSSVAANAWDGVDTSTGNQVEIESGELVRSGRTIEFYDWGSGAYRTGDVDDIRRSGSTVEIDIIDDEGNSTTLEMED